MLLNEIADVQARADLIYSGTEVDAAIAEMATEINAVLMDKNPVILCLMLGGMVSMGRLLPLLKFHLQVDYAHATRYQNGISGGSLRWLKKPDLALSNRYVLVLDDILDQG